MWCFWGGLNSSQRGQKQSLDWVAKRLKSWRDNPNKKIRRGESHHQWLGGPVIARRKRTANGKAAATLRRYRAANPDRIREWSQKRLSRQTGRLPNGTVSDLLKLQKGRCIYCDSEIKTKYHLDHIVPLSKGGAHERRNVQLLCPTCNVRKSAKDPIQFAQERGLLL